MTRKSEASGGLHSIGCSRFVVWKVSQKSPMEGGITMDWILNHKLDLFNIATAVVATAAVIASVTPNVQDDHAVAWLRKALDLLAFNFGFAANEKPNDKK